MPLRDQLKIVWDDGANAKYDSVAYRASLEEAARKPGLVVRKEGDVDAALKNADKVITGEYYLPHLAHVSMEPPVAVANVTGDKAEIWAPVQSPGGTREDVAKTLGIPEDNVTVNVTLLGGGFGRKSKCDFALEAALLSKELGAPVKVQWTREDDVHHDFLHTVSVERIEAGLDKSGKVIAWRHRSVAPTIASTFAAGANHEAPFELGMGLIDNPFEIANLQCENPEAAAFTRIGWFRSVSNIPRAFAVQSMVGEIAHATGRDQKEMLLELIGSPRIVNLSSVKDPWNYGEPYESYPIDTARLRKVVELVAEDKLGALLARRHPEPHEVRTDRALYDYTQELKSRFLRSAEPLAKVVYDPKLKVIQHALGTHTTISRVQGGKLKAKHGIRIASVFRDAPLEFLRMIAVHELAHVREKQHDKAFYKLCTYMEPNYHQYEFDLRLYLTQLETEGRKLWS